MQCGNSSDDPRQAGKREQIRRHILDSIASGASPAGGVIPSRADLMRTFQCARATVDQVVGALLDEGVLRAEKGSGTFVAHTPDMAPVDGVAVVGCLCGLGWHLEVTQGVLESLGAGVKATRYAYEDLMLPVHWNTCAAHRAVFFVMPDADNEIHLIKARRQKVPHLVVYRDPPESPFVSVDQRMAVADLVTTIHARRQRRRFAWYGLTQSRFHFPERRYGGFLEGLLECGLPFRRDWVMLDSRVPDGDFLANLFRGPERPDAIVLAQKPMGPVLAQLERAGMKPGTDVTLASLDEVAPGAYPFPVFCLARATTETGRAAGRHAFSLKGGLQPPVPQEYLKPAVLEHV